MLLQNPKKEQHAPLPGSPPFTEEGFWSCPRCPGDGPSFCTGAFHCLRSARAQAKDPGPRAGAAGAGGFYPTLNANEQQFFNQALARFQEVDSVSGTIANENGVGLGPSFNGNSCAQCHAQPAIGGSSPGLTSPQKPVPNPQVALAKLDGATNTVPSFITDWS